MENIDTKINDFSTKPNFLKSDNTLKCRIYKLDSSGEKFYWGFGGIWTKNIKEAILSTKRAALHFISNKNNTFIE